MPRPRKAQEPPITVSEEERARIRGLLIQHKAVLRQVCEAANFWQIYRVLAGIEIEAIDLIAYICHLVCRKAIKFATTDYLFLSTTCRREARVRSIFESDKALEKFKNSNRDEKLAALQQAGIGVSILLRPLFYLPPPKNDEK